MPGITQKEGQDMNEENDICTCEPGYYCRFCRKMDARDQQLRYDQEQKRINHD